jgi:hypothetical protein
MPQSFSAIHIRYCSHWRFTVAEQRGENPTKTKTHTMEKKSTKSKQTGGERCVKTQQETNLQNMYKTNVATPR